MSVTCDHNCTNIRMINASVTLASACYLTITCVTVAVFDRNNHKFLSRRYVRRNVENRAYSLYLNGTV